MKIAIVTYQSLPTGAADDQILFRALKQLGIDLEVVAWDQPSNWTQYDACLIRSVWDYHERGTEFSAWLDTTSHACTIINPAAVIHWNKNKSYLAELADYGVNTAPTIWLDKQSKSDLKNAVKQLPSQQYFLKPTVGADSAGTYRFSDHQASVQDAEVHLSKWLNHSAMMLQPYFNHVESFGETSLIYFGGQFSHAVRKIPVNGDYRVQDTFGATDVQYTPHPEEFNQSRLCLGFIAQKFDAISYARIDFLHDNDGRVYLNEVELIEPSLFFNHDPQKAVLFAETIYQSLKS